MAESKIENTQPFSHRERITAFPFTPEHNGIANLLIIRNDNSTSWTYRAIDVLEDGTAIAGFQVAFYTPYSGTSVSFPVFAGKTYTLAGAHSSFIAYDQRTNYVY